jgi:hypothetical protein
MAVLEAKLVACLICMRCGVYVLVTDVRASVWSCTRRVDATADGCLRAIDDADRHVDDGVYTEGTRRAQVFGDRGFRANGTRRSIMTFLNRVSPPNRPQLDMACESPSVVKAPHKLNHLNTKTWRHMHFNNVFIPCNQCIACCHLQL